MKKILYLLPIITFFIFYKIYDIFIASEILTIISFVTCILDWIMYKKINKINFLNFITIIFNSLAIFFHNSYFIKWKITIIYMFISIVLLFSQVFSKKPILQKFLENKIKISNIEWKKLNFFWALFFLFCSILNIYIMLFFSENTWVNFKVFGLSILTIFSILTTVIYINFKMLKKK
ncbi:Probable intracellular septation protein A [Buchnera aphidicola (Protaphis terricola)]|uniref:septation protein IspZ n=1 Tax=Buchnera aphidicola TaxID=9 RepID=UPI003464C7C4